MKIKSLLICFFSLTLILNSIELVAGGSVISATLNSSNSNPLVGQTVMFSTDLIYPDINITPYNCIADFNYFIGGANYSSSQLIDIPGNYSGLATVDHIFGAEGPVNATVDVSFFNCSGTSGSPGSASASSLITVLAAVASAPIPTLGQWGLLILGVLVIISSVVAIRSEVSKSAA